MDVWNGRHQSAIRKLAVVLVLALLTMLVAACGDDSGEQTAPAENRGSGLQYALTEQDYAEAKDLPTMEFGDTVDLEMPNGTRLNIMGVQLGSTETNTFLTVELMPSGTGQLDAKKFILRANRTSDLLANMCNTETEAVCTQSLKAATETSFSTEFAKVGDATDLHLIYKDANGEQMVGSLKGFLGQ